MGESRRAEGLIPSLLNDNADLRLRYSRVISRAGPRQRGVSNLPSYRGDTRRKRRVTQRAVETCVLARTAALMHGVPATFHFLRPVSLAGVLLAFLPSDTHRMRWMHRTPGRDACRRTKTLEGCQPFERVTSAFLLPSSYRIFLLASLPPESGRDRGREISAGSLPSSRDAELFRVVNGTLRRSSFLRRTSSLFAQLSRLENSRGFIASRENRCELRYRGGLFLPIARRANLAKLSSCESYQPPARLALAEFALVRGNTSAFQPVLLKSDRPR